MVTAPEERMQFAFWLRAELGQRFRVYCERANVRQRVAAEQAIEAFLKEKCPPAGAPSDAAVSDDGSAFAVPSSECGFDTRGGRSDK